MRRSNGWRQKECSHPEWMLIEDPEDPERGLCGTCGGLTCSFERAAQTLRELLAEQARLRKDGE